MILADAGAVVELDDAELLARLARQCERCRAGCGRQADRHRGGLCGRCAKDAAVRARFQVLSKYARRGVRDHYGCRLPDAPTSAPPGSPAKVAVLEERARLGVALWHSLDAPMDPESADLDIFA